MRTKLLVHKYCYCFYSDGFNYCDLIQIFPCYINHLLTHKEENSNIGIWHRLFCSTLFIQGIELLWLENLANTYVRHTKTLDSCFDLIRSHQQCIPWLMITSHGKRENVDLYPCSWGHNIYTDTYFLSSWEDVTLEVTVSSVKSTGVICKTHLG